MDIIRKQNDMAFDLFLFSPEIKTLEYTQSKKSIRLNITEVFI